MTAPTSISSNMNPGPIQRLQGAITFATLATDVYSFPAVNPNIVLVANTTLTLTLGFIPKHIKFVNVNDCISAEWFAGMAAHNSLEVDVNGSMTLDTTGPFTVSVDEGAQGSVSQSGGKAPTAAGGVIVFDVTDIDLADGDTLVWLIDG
jgi:hypothetical protein